MSQQSEKNTKQPQIKHQVTQQPQTQQQVQGERPVIPQNPRRLTKQQAIKLAEEHKKKWMPFVLFLKKKHLKFKTARVDQYRVQYFRTDQLEKVLEEYKSQIQANPQLAQLLKKWKKSVIYFERLPNMPHFKYPKELERSERNSPTKFASFKFDSTQHKTWLLPVILVCVVAAVLFPLWPYVLKYTIFIVCLWLLIILVAVIILRLVIYLLFAMFGMSVWLFPNLFADVTVYESFVPAFSTEKWDTGIFSIVGRIIALSIFGYYSYHLYLDSSWVMENIQITKTSIQDLHDWGVGKLKGQQNFSQSALTNLQDIMNQTAETQGPEIYLDDDTQFETIQNTQQFEDYTHDIENQQEAENLENSPDLQGITTVDQNNKVNNEKEERQIVEDEEI